MLDTHVEGTHSDAEIFSSFTARHESGGHFFWTPCCKLSIRDFAILHAHCAIQESDRSSRIASAFISAHACGCSLVCILWSGSISRRWPLIPGVPSARLRQPQR